MRKISKIIIWFVTSTLFTSLLFLDKRFSLDKLSVVYIQNTGAYPYIVLTLCILMLYLKREKINADMQKKTKLFHVVIGVSLAGISLLPAFDEPSFQLFDFMLLWLGIFIIFFGKALLIPSLLLGIYGFALLFPPVVSKLGNFYPLATTITLVLLLRPFLPIGNQGQSIYFLDAAGGRQTYFIDAACSGSASLAIFLSIFLLMMLDEPLPWKKAGYMLILGLIGTILQNILRLLIMVLAGYWHGSETFWTAHTYAGYILFPAWYILFAYVYFDYSRHSAI